MINICRYRLTFSAGRRLKGAPRAKCVKVAAPEFASAFVQTSAVSQVRSEIGSR